MGEERPVTVVVHRRIKPGRTEEFESAMRDFINYALSQPGHSEIHVLRPDEKAAREYTVIDKFESCEARESFKTAPEYLRWMKRLKDLTEGDPQIKEMGGLAGLFTIPGRRYVAPPPKHKMALVTFVAVYPFTLLLPALFSALFPALRPALVNLLVTAVLVALLTWIVMPALTTLFRIWLFKEISEEEKTSV